MDTQPPERRGRGRPREVVRRPPGEGTPLDQRPSDYPPTARAILDAAHSILIREGSKGLTLVAVAREAHVDVTTVSYHFVTRHGLIEALFDRLYAEPVSDLVETLGELTDEDQRNHAYFDTVRTMYADRDETLAYFEILVMALRNASLAARIAQYNTWITTNVEQVIVGDSRPIDRIRAELTFAAIDGIELHRAIAGDDYPTEEVLDLLERLLRGSPGGAADRGTGSGEPR